MSDESTSKLFIKWAWSKLSTEEKESIKTVSQVHITENANVKTIIAKVIYKDNYGKSVVRTYETTREELSQYLK